jgi:hypothetical protein
MKPSASKMPPASITSIDQHAMPDIPTTIEHRRKALTAADLAELLPIQRDTFLQWAREGRMPSMKINGCVTFDPKTTAAWLREQMNEGRKAKPLAKAG